MNNKVLPLTGLIFGSTVLVVAIAPNAKGAVMDCSWDIANNVTGATACQYSDVATQDFLNTTPMTVNQERFFGLTDWSFLDKQDNLSGDAAQSGSWTFPASWWDDYKSIMLTFKSGKDTTLVSYLLTAEQNNGIWNNPFEKDVSHISYYGSPNEVPEPLTILGTIVAGGFGYMMKRKQQIA
jgi:hypothetical protein